MASWPRSPGGWSPGWVVLSLALVIAAPATALADGQPALAFEDAEIQTVVEVVARLTGRTFLFDPERVTGRISIVGAGEATPARALELLRSALALHGYALVEKAEATWIVPAREVPGDFVVRVIRLAHANADDVAFTLGWVAPPGIRIVPFRPTNSIVVSGHAADVERILDIVGNE